MYVTTEQIQIGVSNFTENEIAKKTTGMNKFMVYFVMPLISKKIAHYIDSFSDNPATKELFNDNKEIDIDTVYNMAKNAIRKSGQFVLYGIIFNETDIDKLYTYIVQTTSQP